MTELLSKLDRLPYETQGVVARATLKTLGENNLYFMSKYILGYRDLTQRTHAEPIRVLESNALRKLIVFPRGSFKSTIICVAYPIWCLARNPNDTILLDSEIYTNSKNFLREIKQHLESNEKLRTVWGAWTGPIWTESEIVIAQRTKNIPQASITVGGIETVKVGQHYWKIIGDDYNSPKNSDTPEKCRKVIDHVKYNLSILNPGGEYVFVATRYAELDIPGWFFKEVLGEKYLAEGQLKLVGNEKVVEDLFDRALEL